MSDNCRGQEKAKSKTYQQPSSPRTRRSRLFAERLRNGASAVFRAVMDSLSPTSVDPESPRRMMVKGKSRTIMKTTTTTTIVVIKAKTTTTTLTTTSTVITTTVTTSDSVTTDVDIGTVTYSKVTVPTSESGETSTTESTIVTTTTNITDIIPTSKSAVVKTKTKSCTHKF